MHLGEMGTSKPPRIETCRLAAAEAWFSFLPRADLAIAINHPAPKHTQRLSDVAGNDTGFADGDGLRPRRDKAADGRQPDRLRPERPEPSLGLVGEPRGQPVDRARDARGGFRAGASCGERA